VMDHHTFAQANIVRNRHLLHPRTARAARVAISLPRYA
jgi:hypothetical protein